MIGAELLVLLLTTRCNLSCRYCYLGCGPKGEDMPWEVFEATLYNLTKAPQEIVLSGGEPTLRPEFLLRVVKSLRQRFPRVRISLQTNGTLLHTRLLRALATLKVGLGLSLDGPLDINESLRGATQTVVRGLRLLTEEGLACGVTVTVTKKNAYRLGETVLFLAQFHAVASFGLDVLRPVGRARVDDLPSEEEFRQGLGQIFKVLAWLKARGRVLIWRETQPRSRGPYCAAQKGKAVVVTPQGQVYPCASLVGEKTFFMGYVGQDFLPKALPDPCEGCGLQGECPGRCPSRAWLSPKAAALDCLIRESLGFFQKKNSERVRNHVSGGKNRETICSSRDLSWREDYLREV